MQTPNIYGTAGNDNITGFSLGWDVYDMSQGGSDTVETTAEMNWLYFGAAFDASDRINGWSGNANFLFLDGDYSKPVVLADETIQNVQYIFLAQGHEYAFVTTDANVPSGVTLRVSVDSMEGYHGQSFSLNWDGSAETDGNFSIEGGDLGNVLIGGAGADVLADGAGDDVLTGNAGADTLDVFYGGNDWVSGGQGNDTISVLRDLTTADRFDGGPGFDTLILTAISNIVLTLTHAVVTNIEKISIEGTYSAVIHTAEDLVAANTTLLVDAEQLGLGGTAALCWYGDAETDGRFNLIGSLNKDVLDGGAQNDVIDGQAGSDILVGGGGVDRISGGDGPDNVTGGGGADFIDGGAGHDILAYLSASESTGNGFDTVFEFDAWQDAFQMASSVTGIDRLVKRGDLSAASFDHDLAASVNPAPHHALFFKPSSGDLARHIFLVVDQNGIGGYQSGEDIVIQLGHSKHLASLDMDSFI